MEQKNSNKTEKIKTTVTFPLNLLQALHFFMVKNKIRPHKQSEIVADALTEYLKARGVPIPTGNQRIILKVEEIARDETSDT